VSPWQACFASLQGWHMFLMFSRGVWIKQTHDMGKN
jgi:hypothetical protein